MVQARLRNGPNLLDHSDSGGTQFNYSEVVGNSAAVAISNAYYVNNRNAGEAGSKLGLQIGVDMAGNILKEFWPDLERKFGENNRETNFSKSVMGPVSPNRRTGQRMHTYAVHAPTWLSHCIRGGACRTARPTLPVGSFLLAAGALLRNPSLQPRGDSRNRDNGLPDQRLTLVLPGNAARRNHSGTCLQGFLGSGHLRFTNARLLFQIRGQGSLFCKFVPGLGTLGPPMAGMVGLAPWKFLSLDAGGAFAWSGNYVMLGWLFRTQLEP